MKHRVEISATYADLSATLDNRNEMSDPVCVTVGTLIEVIATPLK